MGSGCVDSRVRNSRPRSVSVAKVGRHSGTRPNRGKARKNLVARCGSSAGLLRSERVQDCAGMGRRNFLIEGVSGVGKTSVCTELERRGYQAVHGDRELAYQGDPETGEPTDDFRHEHHIWHVDKVRALVANHDEALAFFCGGSRNFAKFIGLFDAVFVLEVDIDTLRRRLDERPDSEWGGGGPEGWELVSRLHQTREDIPKNGISIDATAPITDVVDEIVRRAKLIDER